MDRELIRIIPKTFFDIRIELWKSYPRDEGTYMLSAYSKEGYYIGNASYVARLYNDYGICSDLTCGELENPNKNPHVCCGYSPRDNKYYGWSHRAIHGFGIGDEVVKGNLSYLPSTIEELRENCEQYRYDGTCEMYREVLEVGTPDTLCDGTHCPYHKLGRGEYKILNLQDAKQTALSYAYNVS